MEGYKNHDNKNSIRMRPSVVVNVAMSADGKLSTRERRQVKISGAEDFSRVDRLKADCDAVMVGIGTVLADDPSLTVKNPDHRRERQRSGKPEHRQGSLSTARGGHRQMLRCSPEGRA